MEDSLIEYHLLVLSIMNICDPTFDNNLNLRIVNSKLVVRLYLFH